MTTASDPSQQARAEAAFRKKELRAVEGRAAMQEYEASVVAEREKTIRLRKLRLSRDAAAVMVSAGANKPPAAKKAVRKPAKNPL